ncbi:hypothetical protein GCM10010517_46630 [Streptosporangium fragile]|uniref:Uncharacterized protein n=1 Tax=Streptosporangium fragile TaxID=46186 RepID=A0ABN3W3W8_9ACTN
MRAGLPLGHSRLLRILRDVHAPLSVSAMSSRRGTADVVDVVDVVFDDSDPSRDPGIPGSFR